MTGRRQTRSTFLSRLLTRPVRARALTAGALVACVPLTAGCGVVPGAPGDSGGDTVTVMTWAPGEAGGTNRSGMPAFAEAYARWINSRGGIDGRRLSVLTCDERNDAAAAARCARRAVEEGAVAVVGSYSQHADSFLPTLEAAGIPYIGGYGITNDEFTSPLSYPVNGGQPALLAGLGRTLADSCGPVTLIRPDTIAGDQLPPLLGSGLKAGGHELAGDQRAAETATSYDGQAKRALERATAGAAAEPGCVVPALGDRTGTFMDSFRRSRGDYPDVRTATVLGSVDQSVIDATGGASGPYEGSYVTGWYPAAGDARWNTMKDVIRKEGFGDNRIDAADAGVQTTWIAYAVLRQAVESLDGEVSADTVSGALDSGLKVTTGGLTPTLRWRFQDELAAVGFPRLVNAYVTLQVVEGGRLVAAREGFTDVTKTLREADL
ncbi:ABC transporter substrate-binding protein [Streptomyces sp. CHD11]|uniref:ABC transporter substrate-binding protein n=1 Tax=Streptomyces sp. CHD11 TaxID=2741325 RepID=UPI001BFCC51E|nr:ABC transporter substrate-binding protein [Streptomyces sp. CHD11]MBT3154759.1 ABC transporter substrate-binding protein [Streptomyces sp. CHD11]